MSPEQIKQLSNLLDEFVNWTTDRASIFGRKMDQALASDLQSTLPAYGLKFDLKLTLYNGQTAFRRGYITRNAAVHVGNGLLNTCGEDGVEFSSQVVSFEVV